jgi:hypothetical protein
MMATNYYQDVMQVISRVTGANIQEIVVESLYSATATKS